MAPCNVDPMSESPEERARTLENLGLLSLFVRVRTSFSVSRSSFLLVIAVPVAIFGFVLPLMIRWAPWREQHHHHKHDMPVNPSSGTAMRIEHPNFGGLAVVFGATLAGWIIGALIGLSALAVDQLLSICRCLALRRGPGDDASPKGAANQEPLLGQGGEVGMSMAIPERGVHEQVFEVAAVHPEAVAATFKDRSLTYGTWRLAIMAATSVLREGGVSEGCLVSLFLDSGPGVVLSILAAWHAGAAWSPIDKEAPHARITALLEDGQPFAVICDDSAPFRESDLTLFRLDGLGAFLRLERQGSARGGTRPANGDSLTLKAAAARMQAVAQVVYTSGSTGLPKGVIYSHRRIAFACRAFAQHAGIGEGTRVLQKTPYIWAVFRHEVFPALAHAGHIVFAETALRNDPRRLADLVRQEVVEVVVATPSVFELLWDAASFSLPSLRTVVFMGEGLPKDLAARILERAHGSLQLFNFYGSTETENCFFPVPRPGSESWKALRPRFIPAGRPQPCVSVHIIDPAGFEVCLAGVEGEICFGGVLSDGYWRRPDLTRERFVDHPELGRIYRTGDIGRWDQAIGLQVLGRTDRQVKIRGIRIELEEVEAAMRAAADAALGPSEVAVVAASALGAATPGTEHLALVAFAATTGPSARSSPVSSASPPGGATGELRRECRARMPPYMVPSVIQILEALPRLPNQKVDLRALAALAEKAEETVQAVDSLGMLRLLTRAQVEEDIWIQNQQAFWMLVVMLGHFQLNSGSHWSHGVDCGNWAWRLEMMLGHGKDMAAFILMVGFTDSRDPIRFGPRDVVLLALALLMSGPLSYVLSPGYGPLKEVFSPPPRIPTIGHGWFLYSFAFARLVLNGFHRLRVPPAVQVVFSFVVSCMVPDDWQGLISESWRDWLWRRDAAFTYKGFRWSFFFLTACYLLGFYYAPVGVNFARRHAPNSRRRVAALVGACWTSFLVMSALNAPVIETVRGYPAFQAVYNQETGSHLVMWHYMTHPALYVYLALYMCELLLFLLPVVFVAVAMAYCPVHFQTMGTTSLGNYVLHPTYIGAPWTRWLQVPVLSRITSPAFGIVANVLVVFAWNVGFCVFFAHTFGAWFHKSLLAAFGLIRDAVAERRSRTRSASDISLLSPPPASV